MQANGWEYLYYQNQNGYVPEGILHRPHHGNTLGRQDIQHLREYLAHARATPSQIEAAGKH